MKIISESLVRRLLKEESGQMIPIMAVILLGFLGTAALSIDLGRAFVGYRELQASSNAAALAGAKSLPDTSAATAAATYSSQEGGLNAQGNLPVVTMASGYPMLKCLSSLSNQGMSCVAPANANAIQVKQQMTVPLFFAQIFGRKTLTISATATASMSGAAPSPYNVAIIVDTTLSMSMYDSNCGATQMQCALTGIQVLLNAFWPCASDHATCSVSNGIATDSVDSVALFTFPNVSVGTAALDSNCTTPIPSPTQSNHFSYDSNYGNYSMLPDAPTPWSGVPTAVPYSFPTAGASTYAPNSSPTTTPTYQLTGFLSDYRVSDTSASMNTSSILVKAAGGKSGCGSMIPPNYDGDYGTYFAGAIYAAQSALTAQQLVNPGSQNVIILLGDGDSKAPHTFSRNSTTITVMPSPATSNGSYPSWVNQCGQAVTAGQYAASHGTTVFAVAYGSSTSGCNTDNSPRISPCATLQGIASASQNFYSDYNQSGSDGTCIAPAHQTTSDLKQIFTQIAGALSVARLIPNGTT